MELFAKPSLHYGLSELVLKLPLAPNLCVGANVSAHEMCRNFNTLESVRCIGLEHDGLF